MNDCTKYGSPEDSVGFLVWKFNNKLETSLQNVLLREGISYNHFMVLASLLWLVKDGGLINQRVVMGYVNMREITVSTILRKLKKNGLITTKVNVTDRRSKLVGITKKGSTLVYSTLDVCMNLETRIPNHNNLQKVLHPLV